MKRLLLLAAVTLTASSADAQIDARMVRYPDVSAEHIAFVYAGDIWVAPKAGGSAHRLSSPRGEESFPRFSPDGATLAFTGNYDGNADIYVVPVTGGLPERITHHPSTDRVIDWHPDGRSVLFASSRESGKNRFNQLYLKALGAPLPEKLPLPYGEFGQIKDDGRQLAYMPIARDFRTWKRYRGGMAPEIWLFDLQTYESQNLTEHIANDSQPMWHGDTLYFLSDRGDKQRHNIWSYNSETETFTQVTFFEDFDIHFPAIGPSDIIFAAGAQLYLLDLDSEEYAPVDVDVVTDQSTLKPRVENVGRRIFSASVSPSGKRAVFEARGDVFTVPKEHGVIRNLTRTSGVAERYPAWSPDGKHVAYFSDRTGEYELTLRPTGGSGDEETLTHLGPGYRYWPQWSPDSKKIVFVDQTMSINLYDIDSAELTEVDKGLWMYQGSLQNFRVSWSADSRWFAYSRGLDNRKAAVFLYDTKDGQRHQVTSGFYDDHTPAFDPEGKYLYVLTGRALSPIYSDINNDWIYTNVTRVAAIPLREDVPSPLAPRNDEEETGDEKDKKKKDEDEKDEGEDEEDSGADEKDEDDSTEREDDGADTDESAKDTDEKDSDKEVDKKPKPVAIDIDRMESRMVVLPPKPGNYRLLHAVKGKVLYQRRPRTGSSSDNSPIVYYDVKDREEKTVVSDADGYEVSADRKNLFVRNNSGYYIIGVGAGKKLDKRLRTNELEVALDPKAEWQQLFTDAWRLQRDFFYDPGMHGVDWNAVREQYQTLIDEAVTRWDVNYVIGELIAELNASHTYRGGGDTESPPSRPVGLLGANYKFENGRYRIEKIIKGAPWDGTDARAPLAEPGVEVNESDYLLAVNGVELTETITPYIALEGLAGKTVMLTVNGQPSFEDAREVLVEPLRSEYRLRNLAWINEKRKRVDEATSGRVGYVYVPDTGRGGQTELVRQFVAQFHKPGLIIDERFNSGGQIPDRFVELMNRPRLGYWGVRDGKDWQWPPVAHHGPKVMLINGWSGSGGDAFPYYFKEAGLGPLIGTRTWGGLIGMTGSPSLIDGGNVTVPTFGIYNNEGEWIIENYGVEPDIEIIDDPTRMARGEDVQLERAIEEVLQRLEANPPRHPEKPEYPDRSRP